MFSSKKPHTGHRYHRLNSVYDSESIVEPTKSRFASVGSSEQNDPQIPINVNNTNLDLLYTRCYRYYSYGGARNFALSRAAHIIKLTFALSVAFLLTNCIDYARMQELLEDSTTASDDVRLYHIDASEFVYYGGGGGLSVFTVLLYGGFLIYILWLCIKATRDVRCLVEIGHFYRTRLHLTYRDMQTCEWSEVCERLLQVPELRTALGNDRRTELDIINRIMRRENYLIALLNLNVLAWSCTKKFSSIAEKQQQEQQEEESEFVSRDNRRNRTGSGGSVFFVNKLTTLVSKATLAVWKPLFVATTDFAPSLASDIDSATEYSVNNANTNADRSNHIIAQSSHCPHPFFTRTFEWALHFALFSFAFDARTGALRPEFQPPPPNTQGRYADLQKMARTLRWRFRAMAVFGFLLSPFVLVYILFDFFLQHSEQFRQQRSPHQSVLTTRRWSNEARWAIREFNELPHLFERRLDAAHQHASLYLAQFSSAVTQTLARLLVYCAGGTIGVLLLLGFLGDDEVLTRVNIAFGRSGVWWLSVLGVLVALARSAIPPDNLVYDPRGHMQRCVQHTHYMPETWRNREHTGAVHDRFARLFEFRWLQCVREILGIFYTPYLLWSFMPGRSEALVRFFRNYSVRLRDCGHVCRFAVFQKQHDYTTENENYTRKTDNNSQRGEHKDLPFVSSLSSSSSVLSSSRRTAMFGNATSSTTIRRPFHGKLEASVLSFQSEHPLWQAESANDVQQPELNRKNRKQRAHDDDNRESEEEEEEEEEEENRWCIEEEDDNFGIQRENRAQGEKRGKVGEDEKQKDEKQEEPTWRQTMSRLGELVQEEFGDNNRLPRVVKSNGTLPI